MAEKNGIYKCNICGNVIEVIEANMGELVCCGQPMVLFEEKTLEQEGKEKHVPVIEIKGDKVTVKVGSVEHPMEEKHFIELIEVMRKGEIIASARLRPGDKPMHEFCLNKTDGLSARELCNIHGLWRS